MDIQEDKVNNNLIAQDLELGVITMGAATIDQRHNFAYQHMHSAIEFRNQTYKIEEDNKNEKFGYFFELIRTYVSGCIFFSVASVEANINEIICDIIENKIKLGEFEKKKIIEINDRESTLKKYEIILNEVMKFELSKDKEIYQNMKILIDVRNAFTHFKPEWESNQKWHDKIGRKLSGKIKMTPYIEDSSPIFPMRCMTYDFCCWSTISSYNFMKEIFSLLSIRNKFEKFEETIYKGSN